MAKLNVNNTDKLVFDLRMHQIDYNKQKEESLRHQIAEKYGVPVKNVEVNFIPLTTNDDGEKISLAINDSEDTYICSSSYVVFRCKDTNSLLPQYLMLYFSRAEFNRYARFNSWGSARETFDWNEMCEVKIPIPNIESQKAIANIYGCYVERKAIGEKLKKQIKDICPVLIKGSIEEARKEA